MKDSSSHYISSEEELLLSRFGLYRGTIHLHNSALYFSSKDPQLFEFLEIEPVGQVLLEEMFPDTIGHDEAIRRVITGIAMEYSIRDISKHYRDLPSEEFYFNLHFIHHATPDSCLLAIRDYTDESLTLQAFQENRNELQRLKRNLEKEVERRTEELKESELLSRRLFFQTVNSLIYALEKRDPYTAGHQQRVSFLAGAMAREMGLGESVVEGIYVAGRLHDLGKIYVPSEFLTRPGHLTEEEYNVIRTHPKIGFDILKDIEFPWPVASAVLQHHERLDGSGYPYGIEGDMISLESKILAVADLVEAMATNRPYRISPGLDNALEELDEKRNTWYDSDCVDVCIDLFTKKNYKWEPLYSDITNSGPSAHLITVPDILM